MGRAWHHQASAGRGPWKRKAAPQGAARENVCLSLRWGRVLPMHPSPRGLVRPVFAHTFKQGQGYGRQLNVIEELVFVVK